ncbi:acid phosphatase [Planctomonas sp. JC2975]|uniref:alkaline phosphatase family protein n=1 Tax=Planctomonas sp. JC2975 TaxID=2729626 RepID=UPI001475F728|nr:alkaline phosphatase family protein [Planctomonas sp. JC2975]NNC12364.1 acid phosphatase [Planctomonas sp. JC2975]
MGSVTQAISRETESGGRRPVRQVAGPASRGSRALWAACSALLALLFTACTGGGTTTPPSTVQVSSAKSASSSAAASAGPTTSMAVQHVVVIVDENKPATSVIGSSQAPYLSSLADSFAQASDYSAITHPSLPNYLAMTTGTTAGITSDCNPPGGSCLDKGPNLAQALDRSQHSWKMYAESMPAPCTSTNAGLYAVKHNPFLYLPSVTQDAAYCQAHDVPYSQFATDLRSTSSLPDFSFISPNLCNDMHDCSVSTGDTWMRTNVPKILESPAFTRQRSLLVITFDEGDSADNVVPCIFAGPAARAHFVSFASFTHYSLLRTIELLWGLPTETANDAHANAMTSMLN